VKPGRFASVFFCMALGAACSSPSSGPTAGDASGSDDASGSGEGGALEGSAPDGPGSSGGPVQDASGPDASVEVCLHEGGWDVGPPDATCYSSDDSDRDGVPDCIDGCPFDAQKIAPGVCGCGEADVDSDGDGVPDCIDRCPLDPNNTDMGECGCVHVSGFPPAAAGTACTDPACPQTSATCDGAGVCGDRSSCSPCPGGRYVTTSDGPRYFWYCDTSAPPVIGPGCRPEDGGGGAGVTRAAAQAACAAKGLTLAQIYSLDDNRFVAQLLTSTLWIGANDLATPGEWYWSSPTSDSGALFWSGGLDGSNQNSMYSNWAAGAPGDKSCATISPVDGTWSDTDCSETHGYLCEYLFHY
jgi:hypothetical protein